MDAQFLTDDTGRKTAVLGPIDDDEQLLEDLEDLAAIAERRNEETVPRKDVVAELIEDGLLSD
jgi:hypothetical protein